MKTTGVFNHKLLRARREVLGLSREDVIVKLAGMGLRISASSLIRWEDGDYAPDADDLPVIARALELHVSALFREERTT